MKVEDLLKYRLELLKNAADQDQYISPNLVLNYVLPSLVETKLVESIEINSIPLSSIFFIAGYLENESGERLQIFLVDEASTSIATAPEDLLHSKKDYYESIFALGLDFLKKSINQQLNSLQDSDPLAVLYCKLGSAAFLDQVDVIEFVLLSASFPIENRGKEQTLKKLSFDDVELSIQKNPNLVNLTRKKELLIQYKLVDIEYIKNVSITQGNAYPLLVKFIDTFGSDIEVLKAAEGVNFETYLCVLPAPGLVKLYKKESSRLLEKNVRSFLNFRVEANQEMQKTIKNSPERFIAYNNGLTITGSAREIKLKNGKYFISSITDFQIVNGGQTTAGLYFSNKLGLDISKINLMAKITIAKNVTPEELNDLITNISLYSNTQTKVSKVDLKSSNNELKAIKNLSKSVVTPNNNKWYFDLVKGEFETLAELTENKNNLDREYPKERRFNKEELGKYYTAWGLTPYLVKLGGIKVFRYFIEDISGDGYKKKPKIIDTVFYEDLIVKIILFRELEKLYGYGKNAMGQLRSAVIPYTLSSLYLYMNANKEKPNLDLGLIWRNQSIDDMMKSFLTDLMKLINNLIKKYSQSDDYGTFAKNEQLWKDISKSTELYNFFNNENALIFMNRYGIAKKRESNNKHELDFSILKKVVYYAAYGNDKLKNIINEFSSDFNDEDKAILNKALHMLKLNKDIDVESIIVLDSLFEKVSIQKPILLNETDNNITNLSNTLLKIIELYVNAKKHNKSVISEFKTLAKKAKLGDIIFADEFNKIGELLEAGKALTLANIIRANSVLEKLNKR